MLEARSVAVVGASPRAGSFGEELMTQLVRGGFGGAVHPVNPSYGEVMGHPCVPSLADLPEPVDLVLLGVKNEQLEEQLRAAAEAGATAAVIFASCWEDPAPERLPLPDRLAAIAREAGMALCGGNCMGFINFETDLRACGFSQPFDVAPGPITFISHSGSAFSAMLHNNRGLRFNLAVSAGTELVTTASDYLAYALDLPSTRAVGLFLETVRDPGPFREAMARAVELDVPVLALKIGRERLTQELVAAHSGAEAGDDAEYDALFETSGVMRVESLDEMADAMELLVGGRRAGPGGLAAIHHSGGERALLVDAAAHLGVPLARISDATRERLAAILEPGLSPVNPLDAWGTGNRAVSIFLDSMRALLEDPDTAALAVGMDLTTDLVPHEAYRLVAEEIYAKTDKPVAVLANMASAIDPNDAALVRSLGIPVLEGTSNGLAAFRHLFRYREFRSRSRRRGTDLGE
jgi:acyl-CoA synthetase (NDP forming)